MTSVPRAASLGAPPPKPTTRGLDLGEPPQPTQTKGNIRTDKFVQLNCRLDPETHESIKITSIREKMNLAEYITFLHERYLQEKTRKRA